MDGIHNRDSDPVGYEFGTVDVPDLAHDAGDGDAPVYSTGTTTVGIRTDEGVVLGTDRRASLGGRFVANKDVVKVEQVHPTAAVTIAGSVGGAQAYTRQLRAEASLYENRRGEPMAMQGLSTLAGNMLRGLPVGIILGGVDGTGAHLFQVDGAGGVLTESDYTATGSGMQIATGTLEDRYNPEGDIEDAQLAAGDAIAAASERDTASGNGFVLAVITEEGVQTDAYKSTEEVN
jgi:proteasome beta subunit